MYMKTVRIYGKEGHLQAQSFGSTESFDWSEGGNVRKLILFREDKTHTNEYVLLTVIRNTKKECDREICAQITDGFFENCNVGKVEVIGESEVEYETLA